jgi:sugar phosphate isomerase/epimerase
MTTHPEELDAAGLSTQIERLGLQVSAIASGALAFALGLTLLHADAETSRAAHERLYRLIDFADQMKAPLVTVGSFRGRLANVPDQNGRERLAGILGEAAAYAQAHSVLLAIEPLNRYESDMIVNAEQGLEFVAWVNHPAVGLLLDTYHVNIEESSWTEPFRRVMQAGKLFHVHLGDNNRLPPGKGLIDFSVIVNVLRQTGYRGYLSAELLGKPDPDSAAAQTITYMRSLLNAH